MRLVIRKYETVIRAIVHKPRSNATEAAQTKFRKFDFDHIA